MPRRSTPAPVTSVPLSRVRIRLELPAVQLSVSLQVVARKVRHACRGTLASGRTLGPLLLMTALMLAFDGVATAAPTPGDLPAPVTTTAAGDGCTTAPDGHGLADFDRACAAHDECYSRGSTKSRRQCDDEFRAALHAECGRAYPSDVGDPNFRRLAAACHQTADIYYGAVRNRGRSHYEGSGNPA